MRSLLCLPNTLGDFQRTHVEPLVPQSGKRGIAAAYMADSFSAVVATWRPADPEVVIPDGVGPMVARQFEADLRHVADTEATGAPVRRMLLLASSRVRFPVLEARYLIDGVAGEPAFATVAAFGLQGTYVSIATTVAGPRTGHTAHLDGFYAALAHAWDEDLAASSTALPVGTLRDALGVSVPPRHSDLEHWSELARNAVTR